MNTTRPIVRIQDLPRETKRVSSYRAWVYNEKKYHSVEAISYDDAYRKLCELCNNHIDLMVRWTM